MTRRLALALSTALALAACSGVQDVVDDVGSELASAAEGIGSELARPSGDTTADGDAGDGTDDGATTSSEGTASTNPTTDDAEMPAHDGPATTPVDDNAGVGANGLAILRGDRSRLVVEVDQQEGAELSGAAVEHLLATIREHSDKTEVVLAGGNTFTSDDESWTRDELLAAVKANRTTGSDDTTISIHVLAVRGVHERDGEETQAIGLAYSASTMAVFPGRGGDGLGGLVGTADGVMRAVLVHELGHLLGLVNLTYTSPIDHEDPDHPGHSANEGSVMFHAVESTLVGQVFDGPPPDTFDADDVADIAGLRSGDLGR